jgi:hypothetical protein
MGQNPSIHQTTGIPGRMACFSWAAIQRLRPPLVDPLSVSPVFIRV